MFLANVCQTHMMFRAQDKNLHLCSECLPQPHEVFTEMKLLQIGDQDSLSKTHIFDYPKQSRKCITFQNYVAYLTEEFSSNGM